MIKKKKHPRWIDPEGISMVWEKDAAVLAVIMVILLAWSIRLF